RRPVAPGRHGASADRRDVPRGVRAGAPRHEGRSDDRPAERVSGDMSTVLGDLRYAARSLLRTPGLALTAVAALALGIGANTAIFSVVDAVLLRPMPYDQPDRLLMVWQNDTNRSLPREWVSPANFLDWKKESRTFEGL